MCIRDRIYTKHDKALNIKNTQKANIYTTATHNNTSIKYHKPTGNHNNQPKHKYSTKAEDVNNMCAHACVCVCLYYSSNSKCE